jgi:hypothetical protein
MDHITVEQQELADMYLTGRLPKEDQGAFEVHLVGCEECRDRVLLAEMFRSRTERPYEPQLQTEIPPAQTRAHAFGTDSIRSNGVLSPAELAEALKPPACSSRRSVETALFETGPVETAPVETGSFETPPLEMPSFDPPRRPGDNVLNGGGQRRSSRTQPPFYFIPQPRNPDSAGSPRAGSAGSASSRRPRPWSRRPVPTAEETIAFRPILSTDPPGRGGRRLALVIGALFAAGIGYFAGTATPMLHGSAGEMGAGETYTAYPLSAPAPTREEALAQIIEQSNVVLGGERITLSLIRSAIPRNGQDTGRVYQSQSRRLREYYGIFNKEYQGLLALYKTNQARLQQEDIMFLQAAMAGAEDVEKNMRILETLNRR